MISSSSSFSSSKGEEDEEEDEEEDDEEESSPDLDRFEALVLRGGVCHRRAVTALRFLAPLAALTLLAGCQTTYTRLRVTNFRNEVISEWVARGPIHPIERGYRITAVERISAPPYSTLTTYPDGWRTTVVGPHIRYWRCPEPAWLAESEGDERLLGIELDSGQSGK